MVIKLNGLNFLWGFFLLHYDVSQYNTVASPIHPDISTYYLISAIFHTDVDCLSIVSRQHLGTK